MCSRSNLMAQACGTKAHREAIHKKGPSPIHRLSYQLLKKPSTPLGCFWME